MGGGGTGGAASPVGRLVLVTSGGQRQEYRLEQASIGIGRATTSDIVLLDARASRNHARVDRGADGYVLTDLGSANGTRVNGTRLQRAILKPGDRIAIGDSLLTFQHAEASPEPDLTLIESEADLEATMAQASVEMALNNTRLPRLAIHAPGRTWEVTLSGDLTIGRVPGSDIILAEPRVSRQHARVERRGDDWYIVDPGSRNGTWLRGARIAERRLEEGDMVEIGDARLVFKGGFAPEELTLVAGPRTGPKPVRRPAVIVPGLMGTELWRGSERIWPNARYLFTRPEILRPGEDDSIEPRDLLREVVIIPNLLKLQQYSRIGDYLEDSLGYERGKDLLEFGYDWRQDVRLSARRLAAAIDGWGVTPPITIIAHSLGCLVSRYYIECLGGQRKVERLVLLGGPHAGVPKMLTQLAFGLQGLPFGLLGDRVRQEVARFPSVYQFLPTYPCVIDESGRTIDTFGDETWLPEERRPLLRSAREFRQELGTRSSVRTISIFGYGLKTLLEVSVHRDPQGRWQKVEFTEQQDGDSVIPRSNAILAGSEIHPVQQFHGSLYADADVKMRLKLELLH